MIRYGEEYLKKVDEHVESLEEFDETNKPYSFGWGFHLTQLLLKRYRKMSLFKLEQLVGEELRGCSMEDLEDVITVVAREKVNNVDKIYKVQLIGEYSKQHEELNIFLNEQASDSTYIMATFKED